MTIRRISGAQAQALATAERRPGTCLACAILSGGAGVVYPLHQGRHGVVILNRYPRAWGQVMVLLREHVTSFGQLDPEAWRELADLSRIAAVRVEQALDPLRVFVSSLGTHRDDLPMTTPHLHVHVDPIYDPEDRPRTVYTSTRGLLQADPGDWRALQERLRW